MVGIVDIRAVPQADFVSLSIALDAMRAVVYRLWQAPMAEQGDLEGDWA